MPAQLSNGKSPDSYIESARKTLSKYSADVAQDPQTNSVRRFAIDLFRDLESEKLKVSDIHQVINTLGGKVLEDRCNTFRSRHRLLSADDPEAELRALLENIAQKGEKAYRAAMERVASGVVFTAHPTFALNRNLRRAFVDSAISKDGSECRDELKKVAADGLYQDDQISLMMEHEDVQAALFNGQTALSQIWSLILDVAKENFKDSWKSIHPSLITLASWVGYDLDGRTDIHWGATLHLRLSEKAVQLDRYASSVSAIEGVEELNEVADQLSAAADHARNAANAFGGDLTDAEVLVNAANTLTPDSEQKVVTLKPIIARLRELALNANDETAKELLLLASQMETLGLGTARIHLRINSAQIHSVLQNELRIATDDVEYGRVVLAELAKRADDANVQQINFADLFQEQMTARRQIMLCAQILKHIDADTPIRFLIAESENPATIMGALFLARQFGVADRVDLSPLFETPDALERGDRFVERLIEDPAFIAYAKERGRLSLQFGFSDSGRFSSQPAADMAIERIHNLVGAAMAKHKDLEGVELLLFNTHGESMGRGSFPGQFKNRFDHLLTPWTRTQFAQKNLPFIHEFSFQGGDGFMHFDALETAKSTLLEVAIHTLAEPDVDLDDPFYSRRDISWDFYRSLREWHETLFDNKDYPAALLEFGPGLLFKSGSRKSRRQTGASAGELGLRSLRAIPQNAILQQLAIPLNVACGFGSAAGNEPDRLADLMRNSKRMQGLITMAIEARNLTSLPAFRAYGCLYDPSLWFAIAKRSDRASAQVYRRLGYLFSDLDTFSSITKLANSITVDLARFDRILEEVEGKELKADRYKSRLDLHVLHAMRQALMMHAFSISARLPEFSRRHGSSISAEGLLKQVTQLQIPDTVKMIRDVFPAEDRRNTKFDELTEGSDIEASDDHGYSEIHTALLAPLEEIDHAMKDATVAVCSLYSAYG
ncbi:phosphoenolpyruvate carboxylase [Hirschia maritima]|uniref:phosphoenolpyruvate carboxylase n=1 Tax=Hirschia maritima TaxID=1121961 RepID=UPI0003738DF5|nr:phosphoenolpyruvate carboxylase [Hirschia maritima]